MIIPEHAKKNFAPDPTDDKQTALSKLYYISHDKITRQAQAEQEEKEFNLKYSEIMKMKKDKTAKGLLELQLAIEELLGENK